VGTAEHDCNIRHLLTQLTSEQPNACKRSGFAVAHPGVTHARRLCVDSLRGLDQLLDERASPVNGETHDGRATITGIRTECSTLLLTEPSTIRSNAPRP